MVQCSIHKLKKGQQTCHKNSQSFSFFSESIFKHTKTFSFNKGLVLISSHDPTRVCDMVLITFHYSRNNPRIKLATVFRSTKKTKKQKKHNVHVTDYCSHTRLPPPPTIIFTDSNCPCWTNQRKLHTHSCSKWGFLYSWPVWSLLLSIQIFLCKSQTLGFDTTTQSHGGCLFHLRRTKCSA